MEEALQQNVGKVLPDYKHVNFSLHMDQKTPKQQQQFSGGHATR